MRFVRNYKKARSFSKGKAFGARSGFVSYYFNGRLSSAFTALLMDTKVTPNQITISVFVLGVLACVPLYLSGHFFLAGVMVWIFSILDGVDGELARAKGMGTKRGGIIDSLLDRLFDTTIIFSIALSVSLLTSSIVPWVFASIAFLGLLLDYYTLELYGNRMSKNLIKSVRIEIANKVGFWPSRDVFLFIISIASFINAPHIGLLIAGSLSGVFALLRILILLKRYKY